MKVLLDPVSGLFGARVIKQGNFDVVRMEYKKFPDGEDYVRIISNVKGEHVAIITTGYPEQNSSIIRVLLEAKALKDNGASKVTVVFGYFPYARQDKVFLPGEAVSARVIAETILAFADELVFVDVHAPHAYSGLPVAELKATPAWAEYISALGDAFVIAPDVGRVDYVEEVARLSGVSYTHFIKRRDLKTGKIVGHEPADPKALAELCEGHETAVVLDDIISTGGTAASVIRTLRKFFEGKIVAAFTHGLFLPGAVEKLIEAGADEIVSTDTVRNPFAKVTVSKIIAEYLLSAGQ